MRLLRWRTARSSSAPSKPEEFGSSALPASSSLVAGVQSGVASCDNGVRVSVRVEINATPDEVWAVMRDPDCARIFRNIKVVHYRDVVEDDGVGNRKLKVSHRAIAKLLLVTLSFDTKLWVWENTRGKAMRYAVCEPTLMKTYEGRWSLTPLPPAGLPAQRPPPRGRQQREQGNQLRSEGLNSWSQQCWHQLSGVNSRSRTLLSLEQTMVPSMPLPGPVQRCLGELCSRQIASCVADLDKELQLRKGASKDGNRTVVALTTAWRDATSFASVSLHTFVTTLAALDA